MLSQPHGGLALLLALLSLTTPAHAINGRPDSEASSECALSGVDNSNYTLSLHIVAIFVVFASSGIGITLPFITKLSSRRPSTAASTASGWRAWLTWHEVFFVSKYFGAGVILATAFVHLTYEAFIQLSSPCINLAFQPTAPAISMASMFLIFLVDFLLMRHIHRSRAAMEKVKAMRAKTRTATESITLNTIQQTDSLTARAPVPAPEKLDTNTPTPTATAEAEAEANRAMLQEEEDRIAEAKLAERAKELDVMVIEGGIVFHSVMVGLGLGTSSDAGFIPYFIAIVFHQMFDGFAIGTRMVELDFTNKRRKQTIMFLAYAFVTPIGIALGTGVRSTFEPNDPATILAIGILDSMSAGVLLYGALVDLLAKEFLFGQMLDASNKRICVALVSLLWGAGVMSLIGKWA